MQYDKITRLFVKTREYTDKEGQLVEYRQEYPFSTYSFIFEKQQDEHLQAVFNYFQQLFLDGKPESFKYGKSISAGRKLLVDTQKAASDLTAFAYDANYHQYEHNQHKVIENYLMRNDKFTMAVEVPVWYQDEKGDLYAGHADGIRYFPKETIKFEVFDFKPEAGKETKAASQVYRYMRGLAHCAGIPPSLIRGVYFDDKEAYYIYNI